MIEEREWGNRAVPIQDVHINGKCHFQCGKFANFNFKSTNLLHSANRFKWQSDKWKYVNIQRVFFWKSLSFIWLYQIIKKQVANTYVHNKPHINIRSTNVLNDRKTLQRNLFRSNAKMVNSIAQSWNHSRLIQWIRTLASTTISDFSTFDSKVVVSLEKIRWKWFD